VTDHGAPTSGHDPAAILRRGLDGTTPGSGPHTSDLSIDELLAIHAVGYDALELVTGNSTISIPLMAWTLSRDEVTEASFAHRHAFETATSRLLAECAAAGGEGVVGVDVHVRQVGHGVSVDLTGTAVRRIDSHESTRAHPFASDLSGQAFAKLKMAGWRPVGLALGASYMHVQRATASQVLGRVGQNVELTTMTEALYAARESAMERMQSMAIAFGAHGVVEVKVREGPIGSFSRAVLFAAYGTAVVLDAPAHVHLAPMAVLSLDDRVTQFEATSLG